MRSLLGSSRSAPIWPRVAACPVWEFRERAAELPFQAGDVCAVTDALEPFQHQRHFLAVLPYRFDWRLRERNWPAQPLCQGFCRLWHRSYVTREVDLAPVQGSGIGECPRAEPANVLHRNHLYFRVWPERPGQSGALKAEWRHQVLHEEHRTQDHMRGETEAAHGLLDAPLVVEVGDARLLVRRTHGCVDIVFDADVTREYCKALALSLFPLDARFARVLHGEDTPRAGQRTAQRRLVIQIALDDIDPLIRQRHGPLAFRLACQTTQMETRAPQRLRHRSALLACHSGDENRSIVCHGLSLLPSLLSV